MSMKLSTGLRNYLLDMGSLRKAFENAVVKIYTGAAPTDADDAPTGTLLCTVSKASGVVSASEFNDGQVDLITITAADALTTLTIEGVGFTVNDGAGTMTTTDIAIALAQELNIGCKDVIAIPAGNAGTLMIMSRTEGQSYTATGTTNCSVTNRVAVTREDTLQFGEAASGAIAKETSVWSGSNVATGVAGYFRMVSSGDLGTDNETDIRIQGSCGTSGADLNMSNVSLVSGATTTVDTFSITLPAS